MSKPMVRNAANESEVRAAKVKQELKQDSDGLSTRTEIRVEDASNVRRF